MDRAKFYRLMAGTGELDYERYLETPKLLALQKPYDALANPDELQFQIVHQVEELWMKLAAFTILEIDDHMEAGRAHRVVTLFRRCHLILKMMTEQLGLLETMSPKEYQQIRLQLGNGSGQESPGFRAMLQMPQLLWTTFEKRYLTDAGRTVEDIYDHGYAHDDAYVVAEAMIEFDELFQKFRAHHLFLIHRSIGLGSTSLKGRSVELLQAGTRHRFFPALWEIRHAMTDAWGGTYGKVRDSLSDKGE